MIAQITTAELREKMNHGDRFTLVESLPEEYYRAGHLPGAINLPPPDVRRLASSVLPDQSAEIVVYCASEDCEAAKEVARALDSLGYTNLRYYDQGKEEWVQAGMGLESSLPEEPGAPWKPLR
jgi:rhodanese-related sulfurtransferase